MSGAKNSALKIMAASILTEDPVTITNVPDIRDVRVMADVLRALGLEVLIEGNTVNIGGGREIKSEAPYQLVSQMRASIIVLGPLLARLGQARVAMPGGCNIGLRKIDLHIRGLEMLGATIEVGEAAITARAKELKGARVRLDFPSVGATENVMMAAAVATGTTIIENAAREPEIADLANCLCLMGAEIEGAGSSTIIIDGVERLKGVEYDVIPDRIEASTYLVAGAITGGDVTIEEINPDHLRMVVAKLEQCGCRISIGKGSINVKSGDLPTAITISTLPHPGFPTDMQAPFMALLSMAKGKSIITENVFENRFGFVDELNQLGADIEIDQHHAVISGNRSLGAGSVRATDLRAGAALVLAGLAASGPVEISDIYHIERGYDNLVGRLRALGADIELVEEESVVKMALAGQSGEPDFPVPNVGAGL